MNEPVTVNEEFLYKKGLCGIQNLGNTCYLNSIVQCLNHTLPLTKYFLENHYKDEVNHTKNTSELVEEWNVVSRALWNKNSVIIPEKFVTLFRQIAFQENRFDFTGFGQNDSQEFLQYFLEIMHNTLAKTVKMSLSGTPKNDLDKLAIDALNHWVKFFKEDYSIIIDIFYGQYMSKLLTIKNESGNTSAKVSYSFDPFSSLSLEISDSSNNIYDCLDSLTDKEQLSEPSAKDKQIKTIMFWSLPKILVIFFKRWTNTGRKINKCIDYPIDNLDMSKYVNGYNKKKYKYELYAISNHSGGTNGGHHYAYCKNNDGNWYKFDDNIVSTLNISKVVNNSAYCLFYRIK